VGSPRLRHRVECNGFFARLAFTCRRRGWRLEWTGERRAAAEWDSSLTGGPLVTPDGKGRIVAGEREVSFFLEYDRGTEHLEQLELKIERYRLVWGSPRQPDALLFVFPSAARSARCGASSPVPDSPSPPPFEPTRFPIRWVPEKTHPSGIDCRG